MGIANIAWNQVKKAIEFELRLKENGAQRDSLRYAVQSDKLIILLFYGVIT